MKTLISSLLAFAVFAHICLGCCWHHGDACALGLDARSGELHGHLVYEHCHALGHGHRHGDTNGQDPSDNRPPAHQLKCNSQSCSFLPRENSTETDSEASGEILEPQIVATVHVAPWYQSRLQCATTLFTSNPMLCGKLRAHLQICVLLI